MVMTADERMEAARASRVRPTFRLRCPACDQVVTLYVAHATASCCGRRGARHDERMMRREEIR